MKRPIWNEEELGGLEVLRVGGGHSVNTAGGIY